MGRNLLSCLFFVLLFLQGGLCRVLCMWGRKQGGACLAGSLNGSPLGEPCWECPMEHGDMSKYLYSVVPVHPQGSRGLRVVELLVDIPPSRHTKTSWAPWRSSSKEETSQGTGLHEVLWAAEGTHPRWAAFEAPLAQEEARMIASPQGQTEDLSFEMNSGCS